MVFHETKMRIFQGKLLVYQRVYSANNSRLYIHKFWKKLPGSSGHLLCNLLVQTPFCFFRQNCFQQKRFSCYWNYNCFSTSTNLTSAKKTSSILPNGMKRNINQPKCFPEIFGGPIFPSFKKRLPTILEGGKNLLKGGFSAFTWSNQSFGAKDLPFGKWVGSTLGLLGAVGSPELKLPI